MLTKKVGSQIESINTSQRMFPNYNDPTPTDNLVRPRKSGGGFTSVERLKVSIKEHATGKSQPGKKEKSYLNRQNRPMPLQQALILNICKKTVESRSP